MITRKLYRSDGFRIPSYVPWCRWPIYTCIASACAEDVSLFQQRRYKPNFFNIIPLYTLSIWSRACPYFITFLLLWFNKKNVGIFIKFSIIAYQIHINIFRNVTGYQHKTIFSSVVDTLDFWMKFIKQRIIYYTFWFYRNKVGCTRADKLYH